MNEHIDLIKILKDCPKGTAFWSDNYGEVHFSCIETNFDEPIVTKRSDGHVATYTKEGWYSIDFPASCLLWPSKDCRDWSKFTAPWYKKERFDPNTFQTFDKVLVTDSVCYVWKADFYSNKRADKEFPYRCVSNIYNKYCIPYNDDTKHLVGTTKEAPEFYRYWED